MPRNEKSTEERIATFRQRYVPKLGLGSGASTYLIGIWDAVAAIGWQRFFPDWTYDRHFCHDIQYARHLQSIDECRQDFKRVAWGGSGTVTWPDREDEPEQFDQVWFAGNHADIGGSYPENESRLSDITLDWMVRFISEKVREVGRVAIDPDLLKLYPSCDGMMHDECMVGIGGTALHWEKAPRVVPSTAQLHQSVYDRLALAAVRNFTGYAPYRPFALQNHEKAKAFYKNIIVS